MARPSKDPQAAAVRRAISIVRAEQELELRQILQIVKETDARSRVMFQKLHNLQVETEKLNEQARHTLVELHTLSTQLLELHDNPTSITEAQAIIRDFLRKQYAAKTAS